ncbi:MAG: signal peptide peptidase SppA [Chloroflexota bacterium]
MKKLFATLAIIALFAVGAAHAQKQERSFATYYQMQDFYQTSPGAFKFGLYGFGNPAITSYLHSSDMLFVVSDQNKALKDFNRWGIFSGSPYSGNGVFHLTDSGKSITDYRFSFAFGDRAFSLGAGYGFTGGSKSAFGRSNVAYWGALIRPNAYLSMGVHQTYAIHKKDVENVFDLAVRPFGDYPLAFFGDMSVFNDQNIDAGSWSAGVSWEFLDGVRVNGRYFEQKNFALSLDVSFGRFGVTAQSHFNPDNEYDYNSYAIRFGALDRTVLDKLFPKDKEYVVLDLSGRVKYQKNIWFDNSLTLKGILETIDEARRDNGAKGLVINLTNIQADREMLWEIREKLREFKESGKRILIFLERPSLDEYHLASIADKIVIDPLGAIDMRGYLMGRSYYKNLLDKIDVGFEEIRLFKYKSAVENYAREHMSEADREQRQALVDGWYETARQEISASRKFSPERFDALVDSSVQHMASDAVRERLVDTVGRWRDLDSIIKKFDTRENSLKSPFLYTMNEQPTDDRWGNREENIAVVYAIGECSMETGIKARRLADALESAFKNSNISAIVLRVDSPGGDAMASDYVAKVIRDNKGKKPIIVSQGMVAASGGYWLSMDADTIVAAPQTITGSIGVISAWIYDKGLKDTLGITVDYVKRGKYADLGFAFQDPLLGIGLPVRNLTPDERMQFENSIRIMYGDFVAKVAAGRGLAYDEVEKVAQGRVWTGVDGKARGLVDELGGLDRSIQIARERAKIDPDRRIKIVEYPERVLFDFESLFGGMFGFNVKKAADNLQYLKFRMENNGEPMPVLPIDFSDPLMIENK